MFKLVQTSLQTLQVLETVFNVAGSEPLNESLWPKFSCSISSICRFICNCQKTSVKLSI